MLKGYFEIIFVGGLGTMQVHRGKVHAYVGMTLDYTYPGQVRITMIKHVEDIIKTFKEAKLKFNNSFIKAKLKRSSRSSSQVTAAPKNLFVVNKECKALQDSDRESFHKVVAKSLYVAKGARPDINTAILFLTKRVQRPNHKDWEKLKYMIVYLVLTKNWL